MTSFEAGHQLVVTQWCSRVDFPEPIVVTATGNDREVRLPAGNVTELCDEDHWIEYRLVIEEDPF